MRARLRLASAVMAVFAAGAGILAQTLPKVPLRGTVRDIYTRSGYLEGATVRVTSHRTGATVMLVTGKDGAFFLPAVDPGVYTIAVAKDGYEPLVHSNFCVVPDKSARFDVALGPDRGPTMAGPPLRGPYPRTVYSPPPTPSSEALTLEQIKEAMAFGRANPQLEAPELRDTGRLVRRRTATLWTPFWRVATMTQVAAATGQTFTDREIPRPYVQQFVWIVAPPRVHYPYSSDMDSPAYFASVEHIVIRPRRGEAMGDIMPAWRMYLQTVCDVENLESVLGRQFHRFGTIAAFPVDAIRPGSEIIFIYSTFAGPRDTGTGITVEREIRRVAISSDDVKKWR